MATYIPTYHNQTVDVNGPVNVHYIEAGDKHLPKLLLLHGFPSSSAQYASFIPMLSDSYHIIAPDLPGFGLTTTHPDFNFTFDNLAAAVSALLVALHWTSYAMYIFDYGAPTGLRLALQKPESVKAIISQNGNAYVEGLGHPFWNPIEALWRSNDSQANRDIVRKDVLNLAATEYQYHEGTAPGDEALINPQAPAVDYLQNLAGKENQEHQLDLFYDYRTNVAQYPQYQEYFRKTQVPLLAVWGSGDPAFIPPGAEAFKKDLPNAVVRFVEAGHFALETKRWEIARIVRQWLTEVGY